MGRGTKIAAVMAKHGLKELFGAGPDEEAPPASGAGNGCARRSRSSGPTFAKLGQILSTRPDLLPPEFIEELATLQDSVPPLTEEQVVRVMEEELGVPWEDVFESIDPKPLAAGTIAEVHRATLADGDRVVVKVQRPDAREEIMQDLGAARAVRREGGRPPGAQAGDRHAAVVRAPVESLQRELDFRQEAANIDRMREVLEPLLAARRAGRVPASSRRRGCS